MYLKELVDRLIYNKVLMKISIIIINKYRDLSNVDIDSKCDAASSKQTLV